MGRFIKTIEKTPTLSLSECTDGLWLYDETQRMNLSMRAKSPSAAYIEALEYYQKRLQEVESKYSALQLKVDSFVSQFVDTDDN